eukprot:Skav231453  [mRNA]  locus=scaffold1847:574878:579572:- [translate_table: standard]
MTSYASVHPLIAEFDEMGQDQCERYNGRSWIRRNIMVSDLTLETGQEDVFEANLWIPEGGSSFSFGNSAKLNDKDKMLTQKIRISWDKVEKPASFSQKFLLWDARDPFHEWRDDDPDFVVDDQTIYVPLHDKHQSCIHVFEPFAGGVGGWSSAIHFMRSRFGQGLQVVSLDSCMEACRNFVLNHEAVIIDGHAPLPSDILTHFSGDVLIHGDIDSKHWWTPVAEWTVQILTISSPCPPWSNASAGPGLKDTLGQLLPLTELLCKVLRPSIVLIEQVNGFSTHKDRDLCLACLTHAGYRLCWKQVVNSADFGATKRFRWLGIAVRVNDHTVRPSAFQMWPHITQLTPRNLDALFERCGPEGQDLRLTDEVKQCAMDPSMVPKHNNKRTRESSPIETLLNRCTSPDEVANTFMSMYASQHKLDHSRLKEKGYMGHFVQTLSEDVDSIRNFHPFEAMLLHIVVDHFFVPSDFTEAYKQIGNQISLPHALLLISNAITWLRPDADFLVRDVFQSLLDAKLSIGNSTSFVHEVGTLYMHTSLLGEHTEEECQTRLTNLQDFVARINLGRLEPNQMWSPKHGFGTIIQMQEHELQPAQSFSPITVDTSEGEDEPTLAEVPATIPFELMLKIKYEVDNKFLFCWLPSTFHHDMIAFAMRTQLYVEDVASNETECSFHLKPLGLMGLIPPAGNVGLLPIITGETMMLTSTKSDDAQDRLSELLAHFTNQVMYDQFGKVTSEQELAASVILFPTDPVINMNVTDPWFCIAAAQQCEISAVWDPKRSAVDFRVGGPSSPREIVANFWAELFVHDTLQMLGSSVWTVEDTESRITFEPVDNGFMIPPLAWEHVLSISAARKLLQPLDVVGDTGITITWLSRTLWSGMAPSNLTVTSLLSMLDFAFGPFQGSEATRLVCAGKVYYEATLQEICEITKRTHLKFHLIFRMVGGAGEKDAQRVHVKNSLAASLLEQGFPIEWTSAALETLLQNAGIKKMTQLVTLPPGKTRIDQTLQLCRDCAITIPEKLFKEVGRNADKSEANARARKRVVVQPNPQHYQIDTSYLCNEDNTHPTQLPSLQPNMSGIILMSLEQAQPWITENRPISKDELTVAIVGSHCLNTQLKTSQCSLPCRDQKGNPVILATTLVQLGMKCISAIAVEKTIDEQKCTTVAITFWREDWNDADWAKIVDQTIVFTKNVLRDSNVCEAFESFWGRSIRGAKFQKTKEITAQSVQIHAAVRNERLPEVLRLSGFNRVVQFNSSPIILKLIPPRATGQSNAVLAGPRPKPAATPARATNEDPFQSSDPWATYVPSNAASAPTATSTRAVQGPIEAKFSNQEQRIGKLEEALTQLRSDTQQGFAQVEQREKNLQTTIAQVKGELESSFKHAITQQSSQLNSTLADLRELLIARPKRKTGEGEDGEDAKMD